MCPLDLVMTLSIEIVCFLGLVLLLIIPLHHFGLFHLFISGFCSYKTSVQTGNLGNSLPKVGLLALFSDIFLSLFSVDFLCTSIMGKLVLNSLPFKISLGILLAPGMAVAL